MKEKNKMKRVGKMCVGIVCMLLLLLALGACGGTGSRSEYSHNTKQY